MVLLISYDLNRHERPAAYEAVRKKIEANAISWARPLRSQWFVETTYSPRQWTAILAPVIDANDALFICEVTSNYWGWLQQKFWDWLRER